MILAKFYMGPLPGLSTGSSQTSTGMDNTGAIGTCDFFALLPEVCGYLWDPEAFPAILNVFNPHQLSVCLLQHIH